jgi:polysaccharide pyruvyl transferase WcaK-like protein
MAAMPEHDINFDADWYQETYDDVGKAYRAGRIASLQQHYLEHGAAEGRLPIPPEPENDRVFAYGSFGSNNVGDEAILEGILRLYPKCRQFYSNKLRTGRGEFAQTAIKTQGYFRPGDYLIIGGGGLLYDRPTVSLMADLAQTAKRAGAIVDILRLGCEAAQNSYASEIRRLVSQARRVTVRSSESREIMQRMLGRDFPVEFDFAFLLRPETLALPRLLNDETTIGIVTASTSLADIQAIAGVIKTHTKKASRRLRFVHIPHSRSYFNLENNDRITAEEIWTSAEMHHAWDETAFEPLAYDGDQLRVLKRYKSLDGIVSSRYHGLVFAKLTETPALALGSNLIKLQGFLRDHASPLLSATIASSLARNFAPFLDTVAATRAARLSNGTATLATAQP